MQPQPLSRYEAKSLLDACPNNIVGIRDRAVFTTLYRGGTRISATLKIMPSDIDWDRNTIAIHDDKGGKGRIVVLDSGAMDILKEWALKRNSLGIGNQYPFFCCTDKDALGNRIDSSHFRHKIKRMKEKAGIQKRCHCHGLRHTAASELLEEGFDLATIAGQLGHSNTSTTSIYLHRLRPDIMNEKLRERSW